MKHYRSDAVYRDVIFRFYTFGFVSATATVAIAGMAMIAMGWRGDYLALLPVVHVVVWQVIGNGMVRQFRDLRDYNIGGVDFSPYPTEKEFKEEEIPFKVKGKEAGSITVTR